MSDTKHTVVMTWAVPDGSISVTRSQDGSLREMRQFPEEQFDRATDLFVEFVNERCDGGPLALGATKSPHQSPASTKDGEHLVRATELLVRVFNNIDIPDALADEIQEFVAEVSE